MSRQALSKRRKKLTVSAFAHCRQRRVLRAASVRDEGGRSGSVEQRGRGRREREREREGEREGEREVLPEIGKAIQPDK